MGNAGLGLAWGWSSSAWFLGATVLALLVLVLGAVSNAWWRLVCPGALVLAMAGWATMRGHEPGAGRLDAMVADGSIVTVTGLVGGAPERVVPPEGAGSPGAWRGEQARFELGVLAVRDADGAWVRAHGVVGVSAPADVLGSIGAGDRCDVSGVFGVSRAARNPGEPDWRRLGNQRGHAGWLSVPSAGLVEVGPRRRGVIGSLAGVRSWVRERALLAIGGDDAGVLGALVLGERDASFDATYRVFQRAGVAHVLAVSGFHLALLGGFAAMLVRATGERGRLEAVVVLLVVAVFLFMVPARAPIVRAGVLVMALLLGDALGRRSDRLAVLAWAGLGLLIWRPGDASGLGFLLSVGITATLLGMAERARGRRWSVFERAGSLEGDHDGLRSWWHTLRWWFVGVLRVNASCWAMATPTIVSATGVCSLIAPIATLVIVPMAAVVLVVGWMQVFLGIAWPGGAEHTSVWIEGLSGAVARTAGWLDGLPFSSLTVSGVGWVWCALTTGVVALWLFVPGRRRLAGGLIACCVVYAGVADARTGRVPGLRTEMLDVGDGTAVLIRSGADALLWDCGGLHRPVGGTVGDAARALGVSRVRTALVTHANADHFNGLPEASERLGIETVLVTPALHVSCAGAWGAVRERLEARGIEIRALAIGDEIAVGRATGRVLWVGSDASDRWLGNDGSVVMRFDIETGGGRRSLLMCGDLQGAGVAGLLALGVDVRADVMEAPHHGSANEAAVALVDGVSPGVVLQSTGPARVGLEAWDAVRRRAVWLSTSERGAIFAEIGRDGSIRSGGYAAGPRGDAGD